MVNEVVGEDLNDNDNNIQFVINKDSVLDTNLSLHT